MSLSMDADDLITADLVSAGVGGEFLESFVDEIETERHKENLFQFKIVCLLPLQNNI